MDYTDLSELLERVQAEVSAPDIHGFLCGQICTAGLPADYLWQEFMDVQSTDEDLVFQSYEEIHHFVHKITEVLQSPDLDFFLMLPEDDCNLEVRTNALADWCHGFLSGFGMGFEKGTVSLSDDCNELLEDYARICRVDAGGSSDEEDELALMELIEYVRIGVLMIFEEIYPGVYPDNHEVFH